MTDHQDSPQEPRRGPTRAQRIRSALALLSEHHSEVVVVTARRTKTGMVEVHADGTSEGLGANIIADYLAGSQIGDWYEHAGGDRGGKWDARIRTTADPLDNDGEDDDEDEDA